MTAPWKPGDLPKPGSREYTRQLAEVFRKVTAGKVTVYPPEITRCDEWRFWADEEDVTGEVIELITGALLVGDWDALQPCDDWESWLRNEVLADSPTWADVCNDRQGVA